MSEAPSQRIVTELKVSGHLMALDAGIFCVFHAPGAQPPDAQTGLPGVRLSLPPGQAAGRIAISTFRDDGWIGGSDNAALIRVDHGPAQVLVTIYQNPDGSHEAPRLQVVKLTEAPGAGQAENAAALPAPPSNGAAAIGGPRPVEPGSDQPAQDTAEIAAHIQGRGDVLAKLDGWMGERGSKAWIEGFAIAPRHVIGSADIEYQAVLGRGWLSPWAEGGKFCGSRGMGLPILGLSVRLKGAAAQRYDCRVQASFVDGSTAAPKTGEPCQADSLAPLEAFHVEVVPRTGRRAEAAPDMRSAPVETPVLKAAPAKPAAATKRAAPAPKRAAPTLKPRAPAKQAAVKKKPAPERTSTRKSGRKAVLASASPARRTPSKAPAKPAGRGRR